jgi:hypothetical protein
MFMFDIAECRVLRWCSGTILRGGSPSTILHQNNMNVTVLQLQVVLVSVTHNQGILLLNLSLLPFQSLL